MEDTEDAILLGTNIDFIERLYARFLRDPTSVDPSWRRYFDGAHQEGSPLFTGVSFEEPKPRPSDLQAEVRQLIHAYRSRGHLLAKLDPLGRDRAEAHAETAFLGVRPFSDLDLTRVVDSMDVFEEKQVQLHRLVERLQRTYAGPIGAQFMHLFESSRRSWLARKLERSEHQTAIDGKDAQAILMGLTQAEVFERFVRTKYVGIKRFSLDGAESLIPMLHAFLELAGALGVKEVVIGMAHRGRLNVLANVLQKPPDQIFSELEEPVASTARRRGGDVKYHLGFSSDVTTRAGKRIHLSLAFNPSHLEAIDPVVEGRMRAKQDRAKDLERTLGVPLLIHGDGAFAGQGVVTETLNLARLEAYTTGGTIHLILNNQIGFTTEPAQARSTQYCTALAEGFDIPIFHVNGDDPEACVQAMRLATLYRQTFRDSAVVDLCCFRRFGHNEGDEPAFTQPLLYDRVRDHPSVATQYARRLERQGTIGRGTALEFTQASWKAFESARREAREEPAKKEPSSLEGLWRNYRGGPRTTEGGEATGVALASLVVLLEKLANVPDGFAVHPKVLKLLRARQGMARKERPLDFGAAEALAFATLLSEGHRVRLTGQDTERGPFSHRHAVLHDVRSGRTHVPLDSVAPTQARCLVANSPLSEAACLGFEFGYSLDYPDALVIWEAQFGDFVNGAQVFVDQFLSSSEEKWRRLSGLTLLLPHGYDGEGPEHSSARLERFLQLSANDNWQVTHPTTPAQLFHLLRRQVNRPWRKPLIVLTPKSLLRLSEATSPLADLAQGRFEPVLVDREGKEASAFRRATLCSGKVYFDLLSGKRQGRGAETLVLRLEELYPFPDRRLEEILRDLSRLEELVWVQEEPSNMGALTFVAPRLMDLAASLPGAPRVRFVARDASTSSASGFFETHLMEQRRIAEEGLGAS